MLRRLANACILVLAFAARAQITPADADKIRDLKVAFYPTLGPVVTQADGQITADVRSAYLNWATNVVYIELSAYNKDIPADCLAEVWADPDLRDAMYRSVFPPDPSILQNYARWRAKLGPDFLKKYRSLVIAFSVAKRLEGVETNDDPDTIRLSPAERNEKIDRDPRGNYQPAFWNERSLHPVKDPKEKTFISAIADFMKTNQVAALDLYKDPALQTRLIAYLKDQKVQRKWIGQVKTSVPFGEDLKNAMVLLGQRPKNRDPKPDTESWLRYLVSIYETTPASVPTAEGKVQSWPLFPLNSAPWPLLMPLAHSVPLSEAKYIWESYQGDHGPDRFHTYGPFRDDKDAMPYELQPSPWFWDAWPDRIVHGGECVPISIGTVDFYCSLGKPAVWAGQPGHANLITFNYVNGAWVGDVEQAFAGGPDVTYAQWYFSDDFATSLRFRELYHWAGAEYHLGLALAMNRGLQSYLDTRMAANIYKQMPSGDQPVLGKKLLQNATEANPYNPDIWYHLAQLTPDATGGMAFIQDLMKQTPDESGYWRTVEECAAQFCIMDRPVPQTEEDLRRTCVFLQTVVGIKFEDMEVYATRFYKNLADKNDPDGQLRMGERFEDGMGVRKDENKAREYLARAAAQGNEEAAHELKLLDATIPTNQITVTASSQYSSDQDVQNLINGKGMLRKFHDDNGSAQTMWQSISHPESQPPCPGLQRSPAWVKFDFDAPTKLASILVWNFNQSGLTDRGFRETDFYGSSDGVSWFHLTATGTVTLPRASGQPGLASVTIAVTTPTPVKSVIIAAQTVNGNYGSDCYGLSAVRFLMDTSGQGTQASQ